MQRWVYERSPPPSSSASHGTQNLGRSVRMNVRVCACVHMEWEGWSGRGGVTSPQLSHYTSLFHSTPHSPHPHPPSICMQGWQVLSLPTHIIIHSPLTSPHPSLSVTPHSSHSTIPAPSSPRGRVANSPCPLLSEPVLTQSAYG